MAFATIALAELALVFSVRSPIRPAWEAPRNTYLLASVVLSAALVGRPVRTALNEPLGTVPLDVFELTLAAVPAVAPFVRVELGRRSSAAPAGRWGRGVIDDTADAPTVPAAVGRCSATTSPTSATGRTTASSPPFPSSPASSGPISPSASSSSSAFANLVADGFQWGRATSSPAGLMPRRAERADPPEAARRGDPRRVSDRRDRLAPSRISSRSLTRRASPPRSC